MEKNDTIDAENQQRCSDCLNKSKGPNGFMGEQNPHWFGDNHQLQLGDIFT